MTIWQWTVCGLLYATLHLCIHGFARALPYYRDKEQVPMIPDRAAWRMWGGLIVKALFFAFFGYLWNLQ